MNIYTKLNELPVSGKDASQVTNGTKAIYVLIIRSFPDYLKIKDGYVELVRIDNITVDASNSAHYQSQNLRTYFPQNRAYLFRNSEN